MKFVFDQHDPSPEIYLSRFTSPSRSVYRILRLFEFFSYKVANIVIVTNDSSKTVALSRGRLRPERVYVVRNGPYLVFSHSVSPEHTTKYSDKYVVCCMGWIARQDGVEYVIDAANVLA